MNRLATLPAPADVEADDSSPLIEVGEEAHERLRYTRDEIADFARLSGDANPLHRDRAAAERANFGEVIASGQQTVSRLLGLLASRFSRSDDGLERELLLLNTNFAFKAPVFAEQDLHLVWRVTQIEPSRRGGVIAHADGRASVAGKPCVIGRATLRVRPAGA
ncbi:MAG: MaoC family dehydratase [Rubrivivax sp.]